MSKKHLKRLSAPINWHVPRKTGVWITRPNAGPHSLNLCLTLDAIIRDHFEYANNFKESKKCIKSGKVLVDQKKVLDHKRPIGLMDVITIEGEKQNHRVLLNKKNAIVLVQIPEDQKGLKLCKIIGKTIVKKGKIQLNLHDGRNLLTENSKINVNDSLILDLAKKTVKEHFPFEKGCALYLTGGKHPGIVAFFEGDKKTGSLNPDQLIVKAGEDSFEIPKRYAFVVGKSAPALVITAASKKKESKK